MALIAYQVALQNLLQAPNSPVSLVPVAQQTIYINSARDQIAAEGECVPNHASLPVVAGTKIYPFSAIVFGPQIPPNSIYEVLNVRIVNVEVGSGQSRVSPREWEYYSNFVLANPALQPGPPKVWAQYGQGSNGSIYINMPDGPYELTLDTVCLPKPLVDDSTPEAIPDIWTAAVPYYAAWLAMQSLQRQADAEEMMKRYDLLMARARRFATPSVLPHQYRQGPDPMASNRLGVQPRGGVGGP